MVNTIAKAFGEMTLKTIAKSAGKAAVETGVALLALKGAGMAIAAVTEKKEA